MKRYKQIYFTGYNGFLGEYLLKSLLRKYDISSRVILLGRKPSPLSGNKIYLDFMSRIPQLSRMPGDKLLIHFASLLPNSRTQDYALFQENELEFLKSCYQNGVTDIVYASTGGVYGGGNEFKTECSNTLPNDEYSKYKLNIERFIQHYWPENHLIFRYFFPFGPGQNSPRLFPGLLEKIMTNTTIEIQNGRNGLIYNPVYIEDATLAASTLINNGSKGIFNIAGRESLSLLDTIFEVSNLLGKNPHIIFLPGRDKKMLASTKKILEEDESLLSTPLLESVTKTVEFYKNKPSH